MKEIWKEIPGYENHLASDLGRIKSLAKLVIDSIGRVREWPERILKPSKSSNGYLHLGLSIGVCKTKTISVHKLIAMAFHGHKPCGYTEVVDHIDNNPMNNKASNLQVTNQRINSSKDKKKSNMSSRFIGVNKEECGYRSSIKINQKSIKLGTYKSEEEAFLIYNKAVELSVFFTGDVDKFRELVGYRKKQKTSKYKGVSYSKSRNKWVAQKSGKYLGRFETEKEAYKAYLKQ